MKSLVVAVLLLVLPAIPATARAQMAPSFGDPAMQAQWAQVAADARAAQQSLLQIQAIIAQQQGDMDAKVIELQRRQAEDLKRHQTPQGTGQ
jgi:hypothetical protein